MIDLLSHPNTCLIDHLKHVAEIAKISVEGEGLFFTPNNEIQLSKKELVNLVWLAGAFHDLGKATSYFQEYIREPEKPHSQLKNHALLSALFVYFVSKKYCQLEINEELLKDLLPVFVFLAVKRHHGNISNAEDEVLFNEEQYCLLEQQINSIKAEAVTPIINTLLQNFTFSTTWEEFIRFFNDRLFDEHLEDFCFEILENQYCELSSKKRTALFYLFQTVYSTLLYADKNDVILKDTMTPLQQTDILQKILKYREVNGFHHPISEINVLKNEAYDTGLKNLDKIFNPLRHIYSVTLPTGLGKTITAYAIATKLRELAHLSPSKIIINIPFTSIIDQNFNVYKDILQNDASGCLLKHHHLAEPLYKPHSENIFDFDQSQFLIETWQSETVVTTFVQFLETVLSMDKTKLMKLVHLKNSVILLDEIQTIPYPLWETVRESFKVLGETLNMYFILISATQPLIFTPEEDIYEIIPNYQKYFAFFNRTRLIYQSEPIAFEDFQEIIASYVYDHPDKDILVILNTKDSSRKCYEFLINLEIENTAYYYLSTLITPYERKQIIEKIKSKDTSRKIVVSTQLIEAGVDISVDTVFRQLAPIDSIIQSAGRANRYNEKDRVSDVFLYDIKEFQRSTNAIYGSDLILKTKNVLKEFQQIEEKEFLTLIEKYFLEVRKQSDETTSDLLKAILELRFANVNLKLIEERDTESVFIQINEEAKDVWKQFVAINENRNSTPWERKAQFASIKSRFYDYVINVPIPYGESKIDFDSEKIHNFYLSKFEAPSDYYSYDPNNTAKNIGYKRKEFVSF